MGKHASNHKSFTFMSGMSFYLLICSLFVLRAARAQKILRFSLKTSSKISLLNSRLPKILIFELASEINLINQATSNSTFSKKSHYYL